jgi:AP-3 complex subunit beta
VSGQSSSASDEPSAGGDTSPSSSDMSSQVTVSGQSSSASDEHQESAKKPKLDTSSQSDSQPGPSRTAEDKTASVMHSASSQERASSGAGLNSATAHSTKRRADTHTGPSTVPGNTQQAPATSEVKLRAQAVFICAVIWKMKALPLRFFFAFKPQ